MNSPARSCAAAAASTGLQPGDRVAVAPMRGCGHCDSCRRGEPGLVCRDAADRRRLCRVRNRRRAAVPHAARRPADGGRRAGRTGRGRTPRRHALRAEAGRPGAGARRRADRPARRVLGAAAGRARRHRRRPQPPSGGARGRGRRHRLRAFRPRARRRVRRRCSAGSPTSSSNASASAA